MHLRSTLVALTLLAACKKDTPPQPPVTEAPKPTETPADTNTPAPTCNYLVVFDAGTHGTRSHAYQIVAGEGGALPKITALGTHKVEPGLATFKAEPAKAGQQIADLLKVEGGVLAAVPEACRAKTPTALMGTGGLRLLESEAETAASAIFAAATAALKDAGLDARYVGTISGQQEAVYGWLSVNYALGKLGAEGATAGALDLGGSSAQIAFVPADAAGAPTVAVKLGGRSYGVYAESYIGYGTDYVRPHLNHNACFPKGVDKGTGQFGACVAKHSATLKPASCPGKSCGLAQPGDAKGAGVVQPGLPAGVEFYAFGVYDKLHGFLKLAPDATPGAFAEAAGGKNGKAGLCGQPYKQIAEQNPGVDEGYLKNNCFDAAWISALLTGFGFAPTSDAITWGGKLGEFDASWALGAALCSVTGCMKG